MMLVSTTKIAAKIGPNGAIKASHSATRKSPIISFPFHFLAADVISDQDLADISSLLHRLDLNSVSGISLNLQAKIKEGDEDDLAPLAY